AAVGNSQARDPTPRRAILEAQFQLALLGVGPDLDQLRIGGAGRQEVEPFGLGGAHREVPATFPPIADAGEFIERSGQSLLQSRQRWRKLGRLGAIADSKFDEGRSALRVTALAAGKPTSI